MTMTCLKMTTRKSPKKPWSRLKPMSRTAATTLPSFLKHMEVLCLRNTVIFTVTLTDRRCVLRGCGCNECIRRNWRHGRSCHHLEYSFLAAPSLSQRCSMTLSPCQLLTLPSTQRQHHQCRIFSQQRVRCNRLHGRRDQVRVAMSTSPEE